jgi:DNA topoisomerase-1
MSHLVIVESPSKAKTIKKYLGRGYEVISSKGHIRDLPVSELGVDVEKGFEPIFVTMKGKETVIKDIKAKAKGKDVILASDMDREGEAIAWHIAQILGLKENVKNRVIFSEITKETIKEAVKNPRPIDKSMVEAQFARRILDRIVGYKISPYLWRALRMNSLSAGRVQSVALRFICELDDKIVKFVPEEYWKFKGLFGELEAELTKVKGKSLDKDKIGTKRKAETIRKELAASEFLVKSITDKKATKKPPAPFTTSTLQQAASTILGFGVSKTMQVAQKLYEGINTPEGQTAFITYMRTDSTRLSDVALEGAEKYLVGTHGKNYHKRRIFEKKKSNVQDAHEAIRPTYPDKTPESVKDFMESDQYRLYKLIWSRFMASQSTPSQYMNKKIQIIDKEEKYLFEAKGSKMIFDGFEKFYPMKNSEKVLESDLEEEQKVNLDKLDMSQNFTKPPSRFTEASLVKMLEKDGIGRPSTYASIIRTLFSRKYVRREGKTIAPTFVGKVVNYFLTKHFPKIIQKKFTATMETDLDNVETGDRNWKVVLGEFYDTFVPTLTSMDELIKSKKLNVDMETNVKCEKCEKNMELRVGKYGPYLTCKDCKNNKSVPEDIPAYLEKGIAYFKDPSLLVESQAPEAKEIGRDCPKCGKPLVEKFGRFGKFIACSNYPECKYTENIDVKARGKCPDCGGEVVKRRSKRGSFFYTCKNNTYNGGDCEFISWDEPTDYRCEKCGSVLYVKYTKKQGEHLYCKPCKARYPLPVEDDSAPDDGSSEE